MIALHIPKEVARYRIELGPVGLQAGAGAAEQVARGIAPVRFIPVAVHGGRVPRRQYQELRTKRIRFRNNGYEVVTMPCDSPLSVALA